MPSRRKLLVAAGGVALVAFLTTAVQSPATRSLDVPEVPEIMPVVTFVPVSRGQRVIERDYGPSLGEPDGGYIDASMLPSGEVIAENVKPGKYSLYLAAPYPG